MSDAIEAELHIERARNMRATFSTPEGKSTLLAMLRYAGVLAAAPPELDAVTLARREGMRDLALWVLAHVHSTERELAELLDSYRTEVTPGAPTDERAVLEA